jgi:hypothetical protein
LADRATVDRFGFVVLDEHLPFRGGSVGIATHGGELPDVSIAASSGVLGAEQCDLCHGRLPFALLQFGWVPHGSHSNYCEMVRR